MTDAHDKLLEENVPQGREAVSPELAYVITHMLRGVVERGTGQAAKSLGSPGGRPRPAPPTTTRTPGSSATRRVWSPACGSATTARAVSVATRRGVAWPAPIWAAYMTRVLGDSPKEDFPIPERVVIVSVDMDPSNECIRAVPMAFVRGTEPASVVRPAASDDAVQRHQPTHPRARSARRASPGEPGLPPAAPRAAPSAYAAALLLDLPEIGDRQHQLRKRPEQPQAVVPDGEVVVHHHDRLEEAVDGRAQAAPAPSARSS